MDRPEGDTLPSLIALLQKPGVNEKSLAKPLIQATSPKVQRPKSEVSKFKLTIAKQTLDIGRWTLDLFLIARPPDWSACKSQGSLSFVDADLAVDDHILNALRVLIRHFERGPVNHALGVEDGNISEHACA